MTQRPRPSIRWFALIATGFVACSPALLRADEEPSALADGTHILRAIFKQHLADQLEPLDGFADALKDPSQVVLVVFGDPNWLAQQRFLKNPEKLNRFVDRGGALLVATDQSTFSTPLWDSFHVKISGNFLRTLRGTDQYQNHADCILIRNHEPHPLFTSVGAIATNKPSYLECAPESPLATLASFPAFSMLEGRPFGGGRGRHFGFCAAGEIGAGRVLVVADHSVFINQMLQQSDSDNLVFADNCVGWLTDNDRRKRVLFVEDGQIITDFQISLKKQPRPKLPSLDKLLAGANEFLDSRQNEGFYNEQIRQLDALLGDLRHYILPWLFGGATLLLILLALGWLFTSRSPTPELTPIAPTKLSRSEALIRDGKFWEAVHYLAGKVAGTADASLAQPVARLRRSAATPRTFSAQQFRNFLAGYEKVRKAAAPRPSQPPESTVPTDGLRASPRTA